MSPPGGARRTTCGPYRILEVLGEGGMGTVFLAEQTEPVRRRVAVKVIKQGMDSEQVIARFEAERQALALMAHPNVASVFDAGVDADGLPYFAMEHVPGVPITEFCDGEQLTITERLQVFADTCRGVQHAHQKGVLHRDLKPSNVLVARIDGRAVPKIIDFGIAKATSQQLTARTLHTELGMMVGTPEYMSPEQAESTAAEVDTRTDVYSLGVVLYELLSGALPFDPRYLRTKTFGEIQRILREEEPPRPSTRATRSNTTDTARLRRLDPKDLARSLRGELDWITMTALEKERSERYESVGALATDVERYLRHEPIAAAPPSAFYRLRKTARRHRASLATLAVAVVLLLGGLVTATLLWRKADDLLGDFNRLALLVRLERAVATEKTLYPAWPKHVDAMHTWLSRDVSELRAAIPDLRQTLARLARRAGDPDSSEALLASTLRDVVRGIEELDVTAERVNDRLAWAERVHAVSVDRHADRWAAAARAIRAADGRTASTRYANHPIDLAPQIGLVPIGMNPKTCLWEFYHLRSGVDLTQGSGLAAPIVIPRHDADGRIDVTGRGIVFVLVPGGTFRMGANATDHVNEAPEHEVTLAPFFVAKHELTHGQWARLSDGEYPSHYRIGTLQGGAWQPKNRIGPTHPVEEVSWDDCTVLLRQHGLALPTEAQWEYACRAGTSTTFWTGMDGSSLVGAEHTAGEHDPIDRAWAAVGRFRPNPFGLFDMAGNVCEWTRDRYGAYTLPLSGGDGLRSVPQTIQERVYRGGSGKYSVSRARSARRKARIADYRSLALGVRPARALR